MSVLKGPSLERKERRESFELLYTLKSIDEDRMQRLEERGLSDEELATLLLELAVEKERPTEFFGEPISTSFQQEFFNSKSTPI